MIKNPLAQQRQWMAFFLLMTGLPCMVHPAWGSDKMEVGDVLQKSEKRSIPALRAGIDNTFATSLMATKGLRLDQPDIRAACQRLAEQDNPDLAAPALDESKWTAWRTWHKITCVSYSGAPMLDIIAKYLIKDGNPDELRLNEWMRYWYVYNHISQPSQQSLADISVWEWMKNEERLSEELINPWPAAAMLLAERVNILPSFRERLSKLLEASKADDSLAATRIAAANAFTILNAAGISFIDEDLQGIQVAVEDTVNNTCEGPNLVGAMLSGADLRGADLRGTHLQKACLNQTCMAGAKLEQVCFGSPYDDGPDDFSSGAWQAGFPALQGHTSLVTSVAFSPDGRRLASGAADNTIRMWDAMTGACLRTLQGHGCSVESVSFSPDGRLLASASYHTICICDASSGVCLRTLQGHQRCVNSVGFSQYGSLLASASSDKTVRLWNASTGVCLRTLQGHNNTVNSVSFSPDGRLLASASRDKTIRIWDTTTGACLRTLPGHTHSVSSVSFSADGRLVASASKDKTVRLWKWDQENPTCLHILEGHTNFVYSVSFSPKGSLLASASADETIRMWDPTTGACLRTLPGHTGDVSSVSFSPDGRQLASASWDKTLRIWEVATGHVRYILGSQASRSLDVHGLDIENSQGLSKETIARLVEQGAKDPDAPAEDEKEEEA